MYYLVPDDGAGDGLSPATAYCPKYLRGTKSAYSIRNFNNTYYIVSDSNQVAAPELQQPDVVIIGNITDVLANTVAPAFSTAGFPMNGFTGTTVNDLITFVFPILAVTNATLGLAAATQTLSDATSAITPTAQDMTDFLTAAAPATVVNTTITKLTSPPTSAKLS